MSCLWKQNKLKLEYKVKVSIVRHTPDALNMLLETKNVRLTNDRDEPSDWSEEKKAEHLSYMMDTIKTSFEFVDYIFKVEDVTRAFTHQFVRTRTGSYQQQAMRVVDARNQHVEVPPSIQENDEWLEIWNKGIEAALKSYGDLIDAGCPAQDARGELPTNITTNIYAKFNLRTLMDSAKLRLCTRTQGEYQDVFRSMREEVIKLHPWTEDMLQVYCVAHGTCAFPRYGKKECPVYLPEMDNTAVKDKAKELFWSIRHEAAPIAINGKAM
jgi:flavin-dependent thymidylate synthase